MPQREGAVNHRAVATAKSPPVHIGSARQRVHAVRSQAGLKPHTSHMRGCLRGRENVTHRFDGVQNPWGQRSTSIPHRRTALRCCDDAPTVEAQAATPHPRHAKHRDCDDARILERPERRESAGAHAAICRATEDRHRDRRTAFPINGRNVVRATFSLVGGKSDTLWRIGNAGQRTAMMGPDVSCASSCIWGTGTLRS